MKVSGQREIAFTVSGKVANNMGDDVPNHTKNVKKEVIDMSTRCSTYDFRWGGNAFWWMREGERDRLVGKRAKNKFFRDIDGFHDGVVNGRKTRCRYQVGLVGD